MKAELAKTQRKVLNYRYATGNLVKKYDILEKKYDKCLSRKKKAAFKCNKCDEELESVKELKEHKEKHQSCQKSYQCEECDKCFKGEAQLEVHIERVHKEYECDECDKVFNFEGVLEKHRDAVHEGKKLFCHYYNNETDCPYEDQCIFLHEESQICKYGKACERVMCMFRHKDSESGESDESDEDDDEDEEDENEQDVDNLKPSLEKVKKSLEKVAVLLQQVVPNFKCQHCDFEAKNQNGLNMHVKAKHTNKS